MGVNINIVHTGGISSGTLLSYYGDSSSVWMIPARDMSQETHLTVSVKPSVDSVTGFIACLGQADSDFMTLFAEDGFVKVAMDLGGEQPLTLSNQNRLQVGQFSHIEVQRTGRDIQLTVSDRLTVSGSYTPSFVELNIGNQLYIGGVPSSLLSNEQKSAIGISMGFRGCIGNVTVNQLVPHIADLFSSSNVAICDIDVCSSFSLCQNGGTCLSFGNSVVCQCEGKYRGVGCGQLFDPCSSLACQSGSTCVETTDDAVCACAIEKSGKLCNEGLCFLLI